MIWFAKTGPSEDEDTVFGWEAIVQSYNKISKSEPEQLSTEDFKCLSKCHMD